jgi:hypothetical protein
LALRDVAPIGHLITRDATSRLWVILLLMRTQLCHVSWVTNMLLEA